MSDVGLWDGCPLFLQCLKQITTIGWRNVSVTKTSLQLIP
jgi:hypothetical protein